MAIVQVSGQVNAAGGVGIFPARLLAAVAATPVSALATSADGNIITTTRFIVPLLAVPSQIVTVELNNQSVNLNVYQRTIGLFVDVGINNILIIGGVIALDRVKIVRDPYLGFVGDLAFWDSMGLTDPNWTGLGTRYFLGYFYPT